MRDSIFYLLLGLICMVSATAADSATGPALDARLSGYAYPHSVSTFAFSSQNQELEMAYMDVSSKKSNGRTVVLLHGKNFSGAYWQPTIAALVNSGFRVVVPDQIGFGKSSKPQNYQFTFQALATNTLQLLNYVGVDKFSVVGHSMGGMLAARMTLMFPERVEKLVLVNPIGLEDWKRVAPYTTIDQLFAEELKQKPGAAREYFKTNYFHGNWKPEYDPLTEILDGWRRGPDTRVIAWNAALTSDMIFTQPVLYEFPDIKRPTLLIIGQLDRTAIGRNKVAPNVAKTMGNYPELGKAAARAIPGSRLVEIPDAGHLPQVEAFEEYRQALNDFLK